MTKTIILLSLISIMNVVGCNDQPSILSGKIETLEVNYMNWACPCADFIEASYYEQHAEDEFDNLADQCFYIEPADKKRAIPTEYYHQEYYTSYTLTLTGQFYEEKGIPEEESSKGEKARIFRYDSFELKLKK